MNPQVLDYISAKHGHKADEPTFHVSGTQAQLLPLEAQTRAGGKIMHNYSLQHLGSRYQQLDTQALCITYHDKDTNLDLPAVCAFNVDSTKLTARVILSGNRIKYAPEQDPATILNAHSKPTWKAVALKLAERAKPFKRLETGLLPLTAILLFGGVAGFFLGGIVTIDALLNREVTTLAYSILAGIGGIFALIAAARIIHSLDTSSPKLNPDNCEFSVTFSGLIPLEVKERLAKVRSEFDAVLILCDAQNAWQGKSLNPDPILLGVKMSPEGALYFIIDQFNLTSLEEYAVAEYSSQEPPH